MPFFSRRSFLPTLLLASASILPSVLAVTVSDAQASLSGLQQWYNQSTGLWAHTGWWNSANCLTVIANLAAVDGSVMGHLDAIAHNTYANAQNYNSNTTKTIGPDFLPSTRHGPPFPLAAGANGSPGGPPAIEINGFLNDYYDDEGWWALAWIAVYDLTGEMEYLFTAARIFEDMRAAYNTTPCGGIWWDKAHTYVNAIANELFLDVAAHLANRSGLRCGYYLAWAEEQWAWFQDSGMINAAHTINDGLNRDTCKNNGGTVWSYNQGVIIGALTELSRASHNSSYIDTAKQIADAGIAALSDAYGVLHDICEPACGIDGNQFKGIFARNLQILHQASPESRYAAFLDTNANAIWANDRNGSELGLIWGGPYSKSADAATQSSAMGAIVAALATS